MQQHITETLGTLQSCTLENKGDPNIVSNKASLSYPECQPSYNDLKAEVVNANETIAQYTNEFINEKKAKEWNNLPVSNNKKDALQMLKVCKEKQTSLIGH